MAVGLTNEDADKLRAIADDITKHNADLVREENDANRGTLLEGRCAERAWRAAADRIESKYLLDAGLYRDVLVSIIADLRAYGQEKNNES